MKYNTKNLREVFGETLVELGETDNRILVLDADLNTSTRTVLFAERFPKRFIQCGIAEAEMMGMAAGLADMGYIPFPTTFAAFATRKCLDQLYMNACLPKLPVKVAGSYPGATATECGPSHNVAEDIAIMRTMPNLPVADPGDNFELRSLMLTAVKTEGPVYFRVPKVEAPVLFNDDYQFEGGRGHTLRSGRDITLAGTGIATGILMKAAEMLSRDGIEATVLHCASIKPLDEELIVRSAKATGRVLTLEVGRTEGGFGSAVAETLVREHPTRMRIMGLERNQVFKSAPFADILRDVHMTPQAVLEAAKQLIAKDKH